MSAFVPLINLEAALAVFQAAGLSGGIVLPAAVAAVGQTIGKVAWFELGASLGRVPWIGKKLASDRWRVHRERWMDRLAGRPWLTAFVLLASSSVGMPPLALMSVVAGNLKVPRVVFIPICLVGRFARFLVTLGAADLILASLR